MTDTVDEVILPADLFEAAFWASAATVTTKLPYVLEGVFGKGQIIVFWGAPGSGKTFAAMALAMAVGAGVPCFGRKTKAGIVLYVAAESARTYVENRIVAIRQEFPALAGAEVLVVPLALDLLHHERGDVDRVITTAKTLNRDVGEVALIVVDTLAVTFGGGNENSPEDMGAYVTNIQIIKAETKAAVLIVHHCGKDEAKGMRGYSALLGALDAELMVEVMPDRSRVLRTGKVREGLGETDLHAFNLCSVELGFDEDNDPVTTCVLDSLDADALAKVQRRSKRLGKNQRAIIRLLEQHHSMARPELVKLLKEEYGMTNSAAQHSIADLIESGGIHSLNGLISLA